MQFYKVVVVIDDAKGQLSVTAFQMDQSNVMPPRPEAVEPESTVRSGSLFGGPDNVVRLGRTLGT